MDLDFELLRLGNSGAVTAIPTVQDADLQKLPKSTVIIYTYFLIINHLYFVSDKTMPKE